MLNSAEVRHTAVDVCLHMWLFPLISHGHTCHSLASSWPQVFCELRLGWPSIPPSILKGRAPPQPEPRNPQASSWLTAREGVGLRLLGEKPPSPLTRFCGAQTQSAAAKLGERDEAGIHGNKHLIVAVVCLCVHGWEGAGVRRERIGSLWAAKCQTRHRWELLCRPH